MSEPRRPDFFIVGAPKCGTTALYTYLRRHPDIYMPDDKELYYFCDDLFSHKPQRDEAEYLALFASGAAATRVGEATPWYLYSARAARRIAAFSPDARIVITLRQPADMMYSLHSERRYGGHETIDDFEQAIRVEAAGRRPPTPPEFDLPRGVETYWASARFAPHVRRYLEVFGSERVHIVLFDDIAGSSRDWLRALLAFLDVPVLPLEAGERVNPNKTLRSQRLAEVLRYPRPGLKRFARAVLPRRVRRHAVDLLWRYNTVRRPRPPLTPKLRREITAHFEDDITALEALLGRGLGAWRT